MGIEFTFLQTLNETLTTAIVIIAVSLLLYNLTRNLRNRVARASAIVLACVTLTYTVDVFVSFNPDVRFYEPALRFQWLGIAFLPVALYHLSDALLDTTGLPSRGRRRLVIRILYVVSAVFTLFAFFSNLLIETVLVPTDAGVSTQAQPLFWLYLTYFVIVVGAAFYNVNRARKRCLTVGTRRRMFYLQVAFLTPALGIFPYSVLLNPGEEFSLFAILLVNITNIVVILMLIFLSYPLSFFGSDVPDRVVKSELLQMLLRGPGTALLLIGVINFSTQATRILGLSSDDFVLFVVAGTVLVWQWSIAIVLPYLERWLIYTDENDENISKLQELSNRLLTQNDLIQLVEVTLESICDHLRVSTAFVTSTNVTNHQQLIKGIGDLDTVTDTLDQNQNILEDATLSKNGYDHNLELVYPWQAYWLIPLFTKRVQDELNQNSLIGFLGIEQHHNGTVSEITEDDEVLQTYVERVEQTLDDLLLQAEIFASLEGLLPQVKMTRTRAGQLEYRPGYLPTSDAQQTINRDSLFEQVRAALRHYWGGPGIARSRLIELQIVQNEMKDDNNPVNALRSVLQEAIDKQRPPEGERKLTSPEWMIYNILQLRFIESKKVRDVARRMAMSESDLYRKQRVAIEAVTDTLMEMEMSYR